MGAFWIIFVSGILVAITQIIIANSKIISEDKTIPWPSNVKPQGWIFYFFTVILAILPAIQYSIQENANEVKENEHFAEQEIRDENSRRRYDSSLIVMTDTTTKTLSTTLAKYGYKLDSVKMELVSLRDSVKGTTVIGGPSPVVSVSYHPQVPGISLIHTNSTYDSVKITFICLDDGASFFKLKGTMILEDSLGRLRYAGIVRQPSIIPFNNMMPKDGTFTSYYIISKVSPRRIYLYVRGTYKRINGTGSFPLNEVYFVKPPSAQLSTENGATRDSIINFIKQRE